MIPTVAAVKNLFESCLFPIGENFSRGVAIAGFRTGATFNPAALVANRDQIIELLAGLSDELRSDKGAPISEMTVTKDGKVWGSDLNAEWLLLMGVAIEKVTLWRGGSARTSRCRIEP